MPMDNSAPSSTLTTIDTASWCPPGQLIAGGRPRYPEKSLSLLDIMWVSAMPAQRPWPSGMARTASMNLCVLSLSQRMMSLGAASSRISDVETIAPSATARV